MKERDTYNEPMGENNLPNSLRVTPFSTAEDFFSKQEELIRAEINIKKRLSSSTSIDYSLPEGYFDQLEESIIIKKSESELKEQVAQLMYEVPQDYFTTLQDSIQAKISEIKLKESVMQSGFTVPTDFFVDQEDMLYARKSEDFLKAAIAEDGYSVPEHYFDVLTSKITQTASALAPDNEGAKVITITRKRRWINYVAAAAGIFLIGFGSYFALKQSPLSDTTSDLHVVNKVNLNDVSNEEILEYLAQVSEGEELIHLTKFVDQETITQNHIDKTIDDEDIEEYLNYML